MTWHQAQEPSRNCTSASLHSGIVEPGTAGAAIPDPGNPVLIVITPARRTPSVIVAGGPKL
jgi:hypothetical protein